MKETRLTKEAYAVNKHYAPTSRDDKRASFSSMSLLEYFDSRNLYTCTAPEFILPCSYNNSGDCNQTHHCNFKRIK